MAELAGEVSDYLECDSIELLETLNKESLLKNWALVKQHHQLCSFLIPTNSGGIHHLKVL